MSTLPSKKDKIFESPYQCSVAIIGVGYVGLPIVYALSKTKLCPKTHEKINHQIIAYDIDESRIEELKKGIDRTKELGEEKLKNLKNVIFTTQTNTLHSANIFIITVPTPIDKNNNPDLKSLEMACILVGKVLKNRIQKNKIYPIIIFESTVFPGATEEFCVPLIENESQLRLNIDFFVGYSPERINPGDKNKSIIDIVKVTSGSSKKSGLWINTFYSGIITAGTHLAPNIKTAEAAKVIENTQRDINIALINELSIIFKKLNIDTLDVLEAARTKWNFLYFSPGLVGGHCIGVDPYYLAYKSEQIGYYPEIVLAGRRINNNMTNWVVEILVLEMARKRINISKSNALILGFSFKENCPDIRNTKVFNLIQKIQNYGIEIDIFDPIVNPLEAKIIYDINLDSKIDKSKRYEIVILAVGHNEFKSYKSTFWKSLITEQGIFLDIKGIMPRELNPIRI